MVLEPNGPQPHKEPRPMGNGKDIPHSLDPAAPSDPSELVPFGPQLPRKLSQELDDLIGRFHLRPVQLIEVIAVLRGRAYDLLLILLALPFCTPIPLPGLSTPFGLVIALVGFRLALRQLPWLPRRLLEKSLPPRFFPRLLAASRRIIQCLEFFLKPRWFWIKNSRLLDHACGAIICLCGLLLMLPLPIPFSNFLPALTVVLVAAGRLERDGACTLAAFVSFALTLGYFTLLVWGGNELATWLRLFFHELTGLPNGAVSPGLTL
ncbi:MAG TPA: exopolysaccharide biosynthesis protein [Methylomirabilota bacterium]|nr:exopolysaccharide biosynthesis protein [Methylomirabilota bacterium]